MPTHAFIYLASQSPRRMQLLDQLCVVHRPLLPGDGEDAEALELALPGERALDYVRRVTLCKLAAARARQRQRGLPPAPILCADTTVAVGNRILGKPQGAEHAAQMLRLLSGRTHRVMTAVAVAAGRKTLSQISVSHVRFAPLSARAIGRYIDSGEPFGKAGAYAVQGRIAACIERIDGSYTGIMGLPLHETSILLSQAGVQLSL